MLNPRINELPRGVPPEGAFIPYYDPLEGVTKALSVAALNPSATPVPNTNFNWIANRKDANGAPWPYSKNDPVVFNGEWYQSASDNNTFTPGASDTWVKMNKSYTGGFWKAGVYSDARPWVFSDHTGELEIYELIDPARPFISTNITTEEAAGKWRSFSSKVTIDEVNTADAVITFDAKHSAQRWFKGSGNIDGPRLWQFINHERLIEGKFFFTMSGLFEQELPMDFRMSDPNFKLATRRWTPMDVGDYEATINDNGAGNYNLKIYGPFGGGGNTMPTIFDNVIAYSGGVLDGSRTYFDPEGDLENNPLPEVRNASITGADNIPGTVLTASWTFFSPSGYTQGVHKYQWYRSAEDGSTREAISGATGNTYTVLEADIGYAISVEIIAVQTATAPANGNPESLPVETAGILIEALVVTSLDPETNYDQVLNLFDDNYDAVNFRIPDTGLRPDDVTPFWTSPLAENRPAYESATKRLYLDPAVTVRFVETPMRASNSKGASGTRKYDWVGVIELASLPAAGVDAIIFSPLTSLLFKVKDARFHFQSSSANNFSFVVQTGVKYRFRLRTDINATSGFWEARLQLNYDEQGGAFLFDETIQGTNGGAGIAEDTLLRIGASKASPPAKPLHGYVYEMVYLGQDHIPAEKELNLWRRLNQVAGL